MWLGQSIQVYAWVCIALVVVVLQDVNCRMSSSESLCYLWFAELFMMLCYSYYYVAFIHLFIWFSLVLPYFPLWTLLTGLTSYLVNKYRMRHQGNNSGHDETPTSSVCQAGGIVMRTSATTITYWGSYTTENIEDRWKKEPINDDIFPRVNHLVVTEQ